MNSPVSPFRLDAFGGVYAGKRVLVTGHTGFKGAWLSEWLLALGAEVTGFALSPATEPALFDQTGLGRRLNHVLGDVRDPAAVTAAVTGAQPDFVFHLAAQPLVRLSYEQPIETYATNVMGTVHVLEALRRYRETSGRSVAAVMVTTDKCYENREWLHSYREEDPMGGYDPYSSSKGAAELVIAAYRRSFFRTDPAKGAAVNLASARAGNVIGGGDWALDRIVPDCARALQKQQSIPVRNKVATRPWQHVLEPLSGYLWLGACLAQPSWARLPGRLAEGFNFGPELASNRTVAELVVEILKSWPGRWEDRSDPHAPHEATLLNLAIDKARHLLGWHPVWDFSATVERTVNWYRQAAEEPNFSPTLATQQQIAAYVGDARRAGLVWAGEPTAPV